MVSKKTSLSVLVPVFNEQYLVEESLRRLLVLKDSPYLEKVQVIIINDGSTDNTGQVIEKFLKQFSSKNDHFEWKYIAHARNSGKGNAIQDGLKEADCDITIIHDADLEYHPKDILRMIPLFIEEGADAVYGSRFAVHEYRRVLLFKHELGNRFLTFLSNIITNLNLTDMETCYKAVRTDLLKSIPITSNDFRIEPELTIKLAKRDAKIFEVPINYSGRTYQEGKKINWKDGLKALLAILKFGFSDDIFRAEKAGNKILFRMGMAARFNSWKVDTIAPYIGQNVLEIGAGVGNLTKRLIPRQSYTATDTHPYYLQMLKNLKHDKPYLNIDFLDISDICGFSKNKDTFDTVVCTNLIECLDDDVQAMKNIASLLSISGRAVIFVPGHSSAFGSMDITLGRKRRYSPHTIKAISEKAGLDVEKIIPFNRAGIISWWINGKLLKKRDLGRFQIYCFDLITPLLRKIDQFIPAPALTYIAVLKKNRS